MSRLTMLCVLLSFGALLGFPSESYSQEPNKLEIISLGFRGGLNLDPGGIPPGEKEDFQQYEVLAIVGFPGSWEWPRGWEVQYRWYASAGVIKAAGDKGFIGSLGPGLGITKWDWNLTFEIGTGAVFVGDETFGDQDFGGPVQILGHGGLSYHFPQQITVAWRFQHFSDATIYGTDNRGVDLHFLELRYGF